MSGRKGTGHYEAGAIETLLEKVKNIEQDIKEIVIGNTEGIVNKIIDEKVKEKFYDMMKDTNSMNANFQEMVLNNIKNNDIEKDKIQKKMIDAAQYMEDRMNVMTTDLKEMIDKHKEYKRRKRRQGETRESE